MLHLNSFLSQPKHLFAIRIPHLTFELWVTPHTHFFCWWMLPGKPNPSHIFHSGSHRDPWPVKRIMIITFSFKIRSPLQLWWFWEKETSWLSLAPAAVCPDARFRMAFWDQELQRETIKKRYDWDEAHSWGWILSEVGCLQFHEAKLMDRHFISPIFWIDLHAPQLETKEEGDWNTLSRYFPSFPKKKGLSVVKAGYSAVGEPWRLTHIWEDGGRSRG